MQGRQVAYSEYTPQAIGKGKAHSHHHQCWCDAQAMRCSGRPMLELKQATYGLKRAVESSIEMLHQSANTDNAGIASGHQQTILAS